MSCPQGETDTIFRGLSSVWEAEGLRLGKSLSVCME